MDEDTGLGIEFPGEYEAAILRTRLALKGRGFSILSEMAAPVQLGSGAGRRHLFMTVWEQLIQTDNLGGPGLDVGDHLQLNIVVYEEEGKVYVAGLDPTEVVGEWPDAGTAAATALSALEDALESLATEP